jgi:hypothetical protein
MTTVLSFVLGMQNTKVWDEEPPKDERLSSDMEAKPRYKTFEDAHFFHHHKNKIDRGDYIEVCIQDQVGSINGYNCEWKSVLYFKRIGK